jgi:hypothetical protein
MNRKEILKALESRFNVTAEYLGVPTFDYRIVIDGAVYTIDKDCNIKTTAGEVIEIDTLLNASDKVGEEVSTARENTFIEVAMPMDGHTGITLRNLVNMIYSKQALIKKVFELEEEIVAEAFVRDINDFRIIVIEDFKRAIAGIEDDCKGIEFDFEEERITFKFFTGSDSLELVEAYTQFVAKLNDAAMKKKHTSDKVKITDNEKFTFRVWLIRLGFVGAEYQKNRKVLLKNLSGDSAFRHGKKAGEGVAV